jgi:hypothetical protein
MPATVTDDPLAISCVFSDGATARFQLDDLPCRQVVRDLLIGLVELIHPHGTVNAAGSVLHYGQSIRHLARHLHTRGFASGATDLTRPMMAQYWMCAPGPKEACTRRMLQGFRAAGGLVDARLAELAAGRAFNPQRSHHQLPPYPEADWEKLTRTCRSIVDEASLGTVVRWRLPSGVVIRANTGGRRRICAGCWRASARSGSSHSVSISGAQTTWFGNAAVFSTPAGTCSRAWTR